MKKNIVLFLSALMIFACQDDRIPAPDGPGQGDTDFYFSEENVIKGRMRVKLSEEPTNEVVVRSSGGEVTTGIDILNRAASTIGITRMERTFPHSGKFEERARKEGLHLWYDVWFSDEVASTRATNEMSAIDGIEMATPVLKVVSLATPPEPAYLTTINMLSRNADLPFNDIDLPRQWSYHNPGTEAWQTAGADIRLFDVWKQYNGHPDIIVAIVDGGIELTHPDLQANLWINKKEIAGNGLDDDGNGYIDDIYGYNFVTGSPIITPHRHGTHVAGTIAAANNNETGVCGIAGGDGTPDSGVKLMSCQIFAHPDGQHYAEETAENIGAAIIYGADNGSLISQNSWGYSADTQAAGNNGTRSPYIEPTHKAAIDYFVKYAGCDAAGNQLPDSPMKGGIVLFAAGNNNTSNPQTASPADYEKVLGIAATGPDYRKASYSNYGGYIDISAPGGGTGGDERIYSTTIAEYDYYEYRYGTSMACPHVAGVAALVIEKYGVGKQGFTARQLEEILLTTAYDLDEYNTYKDDNGRIINYTGKLGSGGVDATAALQSDLPESKSFDLKTNVVTDGIFSFRVNMDLAGTARLRMYNGIGSKVFDKEIETIRFITTTVDISGLAAGYYSFEYEIDGEIIKGKFIKH